MATFVSKKDMVISIGKYEKDGQEKDKWRNIGEVVTMRGDDGSEFQFFNLWGAGGLVSGKLFDQNDNNQSQQQAPQQQFQQAPQQQQGGFQQQHQQQPQNHTAFVGGFHQG